MLSVHGRMSLAAALLAAGLANAEPPAAKPAEDKVMTLTAENGKPRRCRVLSTTKHPSGGTAYEVKAEDNGEVFTVVEAEKAEKVTSTITDGEPKPVAADPIMAPKEHIANDKVQKQLGVEPAKPVKTVVKYGKPPQPMINRWWSPKKSEAPAVKPMRLAPVEKIEAARHHDPVVRLMSGLRDETLPSMREYAAIELASGPARLRPEVADALIEAAQRDAAPTVRACCARCLADMGNESPACIAALSSMKHDEDDSVRAAAAEALARIKR